MVKTPPFHGGNMGSNPVGVIGGLAQLGERLPYKQRVTGSSPVTSIIKKTLSFIESVFLFANYNSVLVKLSTSSNKAGN